MAPSCRRPKRTTEPPSRIDPEDPAPRFNLGVLLEDLKRPQEALQAYREAIKLDPSFADAHYNLGLLFESMGKKAEALLTSVRREKSI